MSPEYQNNLRDRASMLTRARAFFANRDVLEVDCPAITQFASIDAHIDLIPVHVSVEEKRYLFSSPEYGMKRLLAEGIGDIYQISHVFRQEEKGASHNPEFTMVEWYRIGVSFSTMIEETLEFTRLFLGNQHAEHLTYRDAFLRYAGFDYVHSSIDELMTFIRTQEIPHYPNVCEDGKDALLNLILAHLIEPQLGKEGLCVLSHYPASQCALAQTVQHGDEMTAERFEIYYHGVELANGYHELTDVKEQRCRFEGANSQRKQLGKETLPVDEHFLQALEKGLPDCCGVAVGFDRLMMLKKGALHIKEVIPFYWDNA